MVVNKAVTVCVVGGGISGLKAAAELHTNGVDVILLEARDRLGGRILTEKSGDAIYDIGASWFHDTLSNCLFDEALEKGYDTHYEDTQPISYTSEGPLDANLKIPQIVEEMEKFIDMTYFEELDVTDDSLHNLAVKYLWKRRKVLKPSEAKWALEQIRYLELWHGISWDMMSGRYAVMDHQGRDCYNKGGYGLFIDNLTCQLPDEKIMLNQVVKRISRNFQQVEVTTTDNLTITCQYVVVTVPQSVLSIQPHELGGITWEPKLPDRIEDSLKKMHFGSLGKFIFEFDEVFWPSNERFILLADPDSDTLAQILSDEKPQFISHEEILGDDSPRIVPMPWKFPLVVLNLNNIYNVPALAILTQSPLTNHLEKDPNMAWEYFEPMLSILSDKKSFTPHPVKQFNSKWSVDPYSRGSYSSCQPGDDPTGVIINLSMGLDRVRFAGEHTILDGTGCVNGAYESGLREAVYILNELKRT